MSFSPQPSPQGEGEAAPTMQSVVDAGGQFVAFADLVSGGYDLESNARTDLRDFSQLITTRGIPYAMLYQHATALSQSAVLNTILKKMERIESILVFLKKTTVDRVDLSEFQKGEMGLVCRRVLWNPKWFDFDNSAMAVAAWAMLHSNMAFNEYYAYFNGGRSVTLEKKAESVMSEKCSAAKDSYRLIMIAHTRGDAAVSLTRHTQIAAKRFGGIIDVSKITGDDVIRMAFFRHFYRENEALLQPKKRQPAKKRKHTELDTMDTAEDTAPDAMEGDAPVNDKKGPPPSPGEDFWTILLKPLHAKLVELGPTNGDKYKKFVEELIKVERALFIDDKLPLVPLASDRQFNASSATITPLNAILRIPAPARNATGHDQAPTQQQAIPSSPHLHPSALSSLLNPVPRAASHTPNTTSTSSVHGPSTLSSGSAMGTMFSVAGDGDNSMPFMPRFATNVQGNFGQNTHTHNFEYSSGHTSQWQ